MVERVGLRGQLEEHLPGKRPDQVRASASGWRYEPALAGAFYVLLGARSVGTALVDSNSTRTQACVGIRADLAAEERARRPTPRILTDTNRSFVRPGRWGWV